MAAKQQDATMRADMADLRGCRLAVTSEVEKEQKLSVRTIKYLTAGMSEIKSCRKYENPIEFRATHHLFMDCNHRPRVPDEGDAIWKRLKCVPFNVRIDDEHLDLQLPEKLRTELPGILAWAVRGCLAWQKHGLGEPPEVSQANLDWRQHDDPLRDFLEDCCVVDDRGDGVPVSERRFVSSRDLTSAYDWWAKQEGVKVTLGRENFGERLRSKGFLSGRKREREDGAGEARQFRAWIGLELTCECAAQVRKFAPRDQKDGLED
jgi:putative DNA primase/helicase